jgi:hypothetical protein
VKIGEEMTEKSMGMVSVDLSDMGGELEQKLQPFKDATAPTGTVKVYCTRAKQPKNKAGSYKALNNVNVYLEDGTTKKPANEAGKAKGKENMLLDKNSDYNILFVKTIGDHEMGETQYGWVRFLKSGKKNFEGPQKITVAPVQSGRGARKMSVASDGVGTDDFPSVRDRKIGLQDG